MNAAPVATEVVAVEATESGNAITYETVAPGAVGRPWAVIQRRCLITAIERISTPGRWRYAVRVRTDVGDRLTYFVAFPATHEHRTVLGDRPRISPFVAVALPASDTACPCEPVLGGYGLKDLRPGAEPSYLRRCGVWTTRDGAECDVVTL